MKSKLVDSHQLTVIIGESTIISTEVCFDVLVHAIKHPNFGMAAIVQEAIGSGILLYGHHMHNVIAL